MFVAREDGCAFFAFDGDGHDFGVEASGGLRGSGALLRGEGELILLLAGDFVLLGKKFRGFPHQHFRERTEEAVAVHAIDEFLSAEAISPARAVEIIRDPRHRLGSSGECASRLPVAISCRRARWT